MIYHYPAPVLHQPCAPVAYGGVAATTAAERLLQVYESLPDKPAGLAAPQVGLSYRVILVRIKGEPRIFYNPRILGRGKLLVEAPEGCLSLPGITVTVPRATYILLAATDDRGRDFQQVVNGGLARVFQHEIDHLDGVLIIDKLPSKGRKRLLKVWKGEHHDPQV